VTQLGIVYKTGTFIILVFNSGTDFASSCPWLGVLCCWLLNDEHPRPHSPQYDLDTPSLPFEPGRVRTTTHTMNTAILPGKDVIIPRTWKLWASRGLRRALLMQGRVRVSRDRDVPTNWTWRGLLSFPSGAIEIFSGASIAPRPPYSSPGEIRLHVHSFYAAFVALLSSVDTVGEQREENDHDLVRLGQGSQLFCYDTRNALIA